MCTHSDIGLALAEVEHLRRSVQLHFDTRVVEAQAGNRRDDEVEGEGIGGGDPHCAAQALIHAEDLPLQAGGGRLHLECRTHRHFAGAGQRITAGGAQE
ncbi:hypothetical protein D3C76_839620 [compost metagenome]